MAKVNVTPTILAWAREQAALNPSEAASKIGVTTDELASWEQGEGEPTITHTRKMADLYKRPLAVFFLSKPPAGTELPEDYRLRTVGGQPAELTRDLVVAIRQARSWQELARELATLTPDALPLLNLPSVNLATGPDQAATMALNRLGVEPAAQLGWPDLESTFFSWRDRIEGLGILVFALRLDREVCRGFSLRGGVAPVIALATESYQARIFTLMHEFAHLMLGGEGICTQFEDGSDRGLVERYCNQVAAGILMPAEPLHASIDAQFADLATWTREELRTLANLYKVSVPVAALRLQDLGIAPSDLYEDIMREVPPQYKRTSSGGGGSGWPGVRLSERGSNFSHLVWAAWHGGQISTGDAARVMNMRTKYVAQIEPAMRRRRLRLGQ